MGQCYAQGTHIEADGDGAVLAVHRAHTLRRMGMGQCYAQGTRIEADGAGAVLCTGHTH